MVFCIVGRSERKKERESFGEERSIKKKYQRNNERSTWGKKKVKRMKKKIIKYTNMWCRMTYKKNIFAFLNLNDRPLFFFI